MDDAAAALAAWERIAPSYTPARQRPWPLVEDWLAGLPAGARVLDVGAGSGRHARAARTRGLRCLALDAARGFVPDAVALAEALPVRDASCDAIMLIAVLGTMPRREDRGRALSEARRLLKPDGRLLVTVWAKWQPKYVRALLGRGPWTRTGPGCVRAPWMQGGERIERPYYLYTRATLRAELRDAGWPRVRIRRVALSGGRWPDNFAVFATRDGEP